MVLPRFLHQKRACRRPLFPICELHGAPAVPVLSYAKKSAAIAVIEPTDATGPPITVETALKISCCHCFPFLFWLPDYHYTAFSPYVNADGRIRTSGPFTPASSLAGSRNQPLCHICKGVCSYAACAGLDLNQHCFHMGHGFTDRLLQPFAYRRLLCHKITSPYLLWLHYSTAGYADLHCFKNF